VDYHPKAAGKAWADKVGAFVTAVAGMAARVWSTYQCQQFMLLQLCQKMQLSTAAAGIAPCTRTALC
jgi:Na+/H+-translocating membrane pyrophosphatase